MIIHILFFGSLAEKTGTSQMQIEDMNHLGVLKFTLENQFPVLRNLRCLYAINLELMKGDAELKDGDEVAVMPPFAGG